METVSIRDAEVADVTEILRITEQSWNAAYSDTLSEGTICLALEELSEGDATQHLIEHEDAAFFVAERSDTIVGYINSVPSDEENVAFLGALYVDPDCWNEGIGTELLQTFEEFCRQRGTEWIQFTVLDENEIGLSFYQEHGYREIDERDTDRFGEPITERVFRGEVE